jgi:hypothetical protein
VRQVKREEVDLAFDPTDDSNRLAEVGLGMPRRMNQRDQHLLGTLPPARDVILHDRDATREAVLIPQPLENMFRCMLLLLWSAFVVGQDAVDDCNNFNSRRTSIAPPEEPPTDSPEEAQLMDQASA